MEEETRKAVTKTFWANGTTTINSDAQGNLNVSGTTTASNVIAIVFAPGDTLSAQNRSTTQTASCTTTGTTITNSLCASNYLEGSNANLSTTSTPNTAFQTAAVSSTFNDQMIYITHDQLFQPVETRIAREAKKCLDDYESDSSNTNHRYPWAARDDDSTYTGEYYRIFGRIPTSPLTMTSNVTLDNTYALPMLNALSTLQNALNAYSAGVNATTTSALLSAAQALITAAQNADTSGSFASYSSITGNADNAGDNGRDLANGVAGVYVSTVQNSINSTNYYLDNYGFIDGTMPKYWSWPATCMFNSGYWSNWKQEVFYQLASAERPGSGYSTCNTSCLSITGSGNPNSGSGTYNAAIIVGRAHVASLNPAVPVYSDPASYSPYKSYYLEGSNKHSSYQNYFSSPQLSQTFVTYRPTDPNYSSVNDLVLCLDGYNATTNPTANCK